MTTEANMIRVDTAIIRLRNLGFSLETVFDGAKRQWMHYTRPGKRGKVRVYSGRAFASAVEELETGR